jgi:hypothetical protein
MRDIVERDAVELGIPILEETPLHDLVNNVLRAQGHEPCFRSERRYQCVEDCKWAVECKKLLAEWRR